MGQISTLFVHKVVGAATAGESQDSARRRNLLRSVGVDPNAPIDPKLMILDSDYYGFCERVSREDPNGLSLPLRVGASMRCDDYGAFGLAWKTAVDLRRSYEVNKETDDCPVTGRLINQVFLALLVLTLESFGRN